jgi:glycosyltransferase involved in cell wall biosynthesis
MKIAIIGTRGIPNNHGGFEQFAENLSKYLAEKGHSVWVYSSHNHPYSEKNWNGVSILHKYDPEFRLGTFGQFIYDFNCILDSRWRSFDVILQLGYTSSSVWGWLLPSKPLIITNMDGLEWQRSKYRPIVRKFLKWAESLAVRTSDYLIADSIGIQEYLQSQYGAGSEYIAYGAALFSVPDESVLGAYDLKVYDYNMLIARLEPENNIETILRGISESGDIRKFLVVGKHETKYGNYLKSRFSDCPNIIFIGGIYDIVILNNLRCFSNLYFHGHSAGGTNPSLLEAMASDALIVAHDNVFNKSILGKDAFYFKDSQDIQQLLGRQKSDYREMIEHNREKITCSYSWPIINAKYELFLTECKGTN